MPPGLALSTMSLRHDAPLTYADYAALPDDDVRRELIEGEVFPTPAPNTRHQDVVLRRPSFHGSSRSLSLPVGTIARWTSP